MSNRGCFDYWAATKCQVFCLASRSRARFSNQDTSRLNRPPFCLDRVTAAPRGLPRHGALNFPDEKIVVSLIRQLRWTHVDPAQAQGKTRGKMEFLLWLLGPTPAWVWHNWGGSSWF